MAEETAEVEPKEVTEVPAEVPQEVASEGIPQERPKAFKIERQRKKKKHKWLHRPVVKWPVGRKMDLLCMIAAVFGLMSLALPWVYDADHYREYRTIWDFAMDVGDESVGVFGLVAGFMLIGSVLALFSRLGGLVQMAGLISFFTVSLPSGSSLSVGVFCAAIGTGAGVLSLVLRRPYPMPHRLYNINRLVGTDRYELNLLAFFGGAIGMMCFFLPWLRVEWDPWYWGGHTQSDLYTMLQFCSGSISSVVSWSAGVAFIAGSIIALFSPLGTIGQIAGAAIFYNDMRGSAAYVSAYFGHTYLPLSEISFSIGFYLGVVCAFLVLTSWFVKWRLRLTRKTVSWLLAWPVSETSPAAVPGPPASIPATEVSVYRLIIGSIRPLFITIIVLSLIVASAGIAYVMPWSSLEVTIGSVYADQRLNVAVYVDGEGRLVDFVEPATTLVKRFSVNAGVHRVALDYGVVGDVNGSQVDGTMDWAVSVKVKPLRLSVLMVSLGMSYMKSPVFELSSVQYGNGQMVNVTKMDNDSTYYHEISWYEIRVILRNGSAAIQWDPETSYLSNGTYSMYTFDPVALGDLSVTCSIVDLAGNGRVNVGDQILITTGGDNTFSSSVTYTLYVLYQSNNNLAGEITFTGSY